MEVVVLPATGWSKKTELTGEQTDCRAHGPWKDESGTAGNSEESQYSRSHLRRTAASLSFVVVAWYVPPSILSRETATIMTGSVMKHL